MAFHTAAQDTTARHQSEILLTLASSPTAQVQNLISSHRVIPWHENPHFYDREAELEQLAKVLLAEPKLFSPLQHKRCW